jgi:hypothetical protein
MNKIKKNITLDDLGRRIKKLEDKVKKLQSDYRRFIGFKK